MSYVTIIIHNLDLLVSEYLFSLHCNVSNILYTIQVIFVIDSEMSYVSINAACKGQHLCILFR